MGWGIIESAGREIRPAGYGVINLAISDAFPGKITIVLSEIAALIEKFKPEACAIEEPFFASNPRVLLRMGQAGGAVMAAAAIHGVESYAYSVLEIKQAVAGYGKADKNQVQEMVRILLRMERPPRPADAADALAAAICHHNFVR